MRPAELGEDRERTWTSLEGDLELSAVDQGRAVELRWTLRLHDSEGEDRFWDVIVYSFLTPGEQLKAMAAETEHFLAVATR
uniref:DUF6228 family protein n=1 Tax=Actinomadura spongiicola TaxID=2303421 RepID=UPI001F34B1BF|nr:DUF6228 family protein [Actinomadura spongiicola]